MTDRNKYLIYVCYHFINDVTSVNVLNKFNGIIQLLELFVYKQTVWWYYIILDNNIHTNIYGLISVYSRVIVNYIYIYAISFL